MAVFTRADSLVPRTSSHVMTAPIARAGRVHTMGTRPPRGATANSAAACSAERREDAGAGDSPQPDRCQLRRPQGAREPTARLAVGDALIDRLAAERWVQGPPPPGRRRAGGPAGRAPATRPHPLPPPRRVRR